MAVYIYRKHVSLKLDINKAIQKIASNKETRLYDILQDGDPRTQSTMGLTTNLELVPELLEEVEKTVNKEGNVLLDGFHPGYPGNDLVGFYVWQIAECYFEYIGSVLNDLDNDYGLVIICDGQQSDLVLPPTTDTSIF